MCQFQSISYTNGIKPVNAQRLVCTKTGKPITIRLNYGSFCDEQCGMKEAQEMFTTLHSWYKFLLAADAGIALPNNRWTSDNSGYDSSDKNDNPRKPDFIKTRYAPKGGHYTIRGI